MKSNGADNPLLSGTAVTRRDFVQSAMVGATAIALGDHRVAFLSLDDRDAVVAQIAAQHNAGREMVVVTSDRELARRVHDAGGAVCAPDDFFRRFGAGAEAPAKPAGSRVDVEEWMEWFGDERNREG